jgi:arylsulfatase A-like enzyme
MLSDVLHRAGYRTAAVGKYLPQRRGFHEFFGFSGGAHNYCTATGKPDGANQVVRNGVPVERSQLTYLTDDFTREAVAFIGRNRQRPIFLYLAYNAVHAPNQARGNTWRGHSTSNTAPARFTLPWR